MQSLPGTLSQWPKARNQNSSCLELCLPCRFSGWTCTQKDACQGCCSGERGRWKKHLGEMWLQGFYGHFFTPRGFFLTPQFGSPASHFIPVVCTEGKSNILLCLEKWQTMLPAPWFPSKGFLRALEGQTDRNLGICMTSTPNLTLVWSSQWQTQLRSLWGAVIASLCPSFTSGMMAFHEKWAGKG